MRKLKLVTPEDVFNDIQHSEQYRIEQKTRILEVLGESHIFSYDNIPATPLNRFLFLVKQVTNLVMFLTYRPIKWMICGDFSIPVTTKFGRFLYFRN